MPKNPAPHARRVWRITTKAPSGVVVDVDLSEPVEPIERALLKVLDPAPVADWRGSSFDLLNGLEMRDHTDTIPGELFDKLFKG